MALARPGARVGGLRRAGHGALELDLGRGDGDWPGSLSGACHHIGTTRRHRDPRQGVTDADGRVLVASRSG